MKFINWTRLLKLNRKDKSGRRGATDAEKKAKRDETRRAEDIESGYFNRYISHLNRLKAQMDTKAAFEAAVGGDFLTVGKIELAVLKKFGLTDHSDVVDVGCGSGRLALQLAPFAAVSYVGTDVVPELLEYARELVKRSDWRFVPTDGIKIPCGDDTADIITFFSVFTHITHEDCYRYLKEAKRVIRPGGRILISFLEFRIRSHWEIFHQSLLHRQPEEPMNQFMDRDGLNAWANDLGLQVVEILDGDKAHFPLEEDLQWSSGHTSSGVASFGQSLAVLTKS
ncbi:MAG TPA: class I SAM-dependent methyltransferase [Opitutaceae bacterium]|nr:class I SAM-dependent methyltransferase [Opitutaceae bacterium]